MVIAGTIRCVGHLFTIARAIYKFYMEERTLASLAFFDGAFSIGRR
jgi:hypothetical protein